MSAVKSKHIVGDSTAPAATPSSRKPCGCTNVSDSIGKKHACASSLLGSIYGTPPYESGASKPSGAQNMQSYAQSTAGAVRMAAEAARKQMPRYATSLARDTLQLMKTLCMAIAIIAYYLVFSYVQLVYVILTSVFYFHNADGPMKLTLTVVMATAMLIIYHLFCKLNKIIGL